MCDQKSTMRTTILTRTSRGSTKSATASLYDYSYTRLVTYLVAIAPGEVLGADVLISILGTLLKWGHVLPVLPVLIPKVVGIDATEDQAGNDSAISL